MPKASVLQSSFSSGEVSPLFYGQADSPRYKKGLQTCQNYIPTLQGPLVRKPGTKFCAATKDPTKPAYLIPFVFSETQSYMLEFGDHYIRFYANNGQVLTTGTTYVLGLLYDYALGNGYATRATQSLQDGELQYSVLSSPAANSILELPSPYAIADIPSIKFAQLNDTLYITHPNYHPFKLQRQAQTYWRIMPILFKDGPYFQLNTYQSVGDYANVPIVVSTFAVNGSSPISNGAILWTTPSVNISNAINNGGQIQITTASPHGLLTGQRVYVTGIVGTTEANNWNSAGGVGNPVAYWTIQALDASNILLQGSVFTHAYTSGGTVQAAIFGPSAAVFMSGFNPTYPDRDRLFSAVLNAASGGTSKRFWGYFYDPSYFIGSYSWQVNAATWPMIWPNAINLTGAYIAQAVAWQMGVYSHAFGYPAAVCLHQNRLVLGGPGGSPLEVDGSEIGNFESFSPSDPDTQQVSDKNAYSFVLASSESNQLLWLKSTAQGLLTSSISNEWNITPSGASEAITPTNFNAQQVASYGTSNANPVQLGNSTFYIQRAQRKVRELAFFFQAGTFRSIDLSEISEHITLPTILQMAVTKETQPLIWGVLSDGSLVSMVYNRDDLTLIAGWTKHILGGQSDTSGSAPIVTSISSISSPDLTFDQLWLCVKRDTGYQIEYMSKIFDDSFLQEDAYHFDGGATFYNPFTVTGVTTANPAVVTATGPSSWAGFSNGDHIRVESIKGLNKSVTDPNGNVTVTNLINNLDFIVAGVSNVTIGPTTTSTFHLTDYSGNPISSIGYGTYLSGGQVSKLVTTISGATWLSNKTISVLADGGIHPDVTVSNAGAITLAFPAAKVQFGYSYKSKAQLLKPDAGSPDGSSIGNTRRTTRLALQLHRTGDMSIGTDFNNLIPLSFFQADVAQADQPEPLFSGMIREGLESAYDFESEPCFQQSSGLPGCIQSVTSFMEEFDV